MKTNPIGTIFREGEITLMVVEIKDPSTCEGCWYAHRDKKTGARSYNGSCYSHGHACTAGNRSDKKQVVFKKV